MKSARIIALLVVLAVSLAAVCMSCYSLGLAHAAPVVAPKADAGRSKITCEELVIKSKDGKHSIVMVAGQDSVGVWVSGPKGRQAAIVSKEGDGANNYIGLYREGETKCAWAVSLDHKGNPIVQTITDDRIKVVPVKP